MTHQSSFAPRDLLEQGADFGSEADVTWRYVTSLDEAVRLSRAVDQHVQALGVNRLLRRGRHSMTDLTHQVVLSVIDSAPAAPLEGWSGSARCGPSDRRCLSVKASAGLLWRRLAEVITQERH